MNPTDWDKKEAQLTVKVEDIDSVSSQKVGLSAQQLSILGLSRERNSRKEKLDEEDVKSMVRRNKKGKIDLKGYGSVLIRNNDGKEIEANVYNAFGKLATGYNSIRVSKRIARILSLSPGEEVTLVKE